jgi:hypothetical protein
VLWLVLVTLAVTVAEYTQNALDVAENIPNALRHDEPVFKIPLPTRAIQNQNSSGSLELAWNL